MFLKLAKMKKCFSDINEEAVDSYCDVLDGYAVNLGDDTDNLDEVKGVGPELFDEGCPYDLKFKDHGIEFGQQELQLSNRLAAHRLMFSNGLKL
ncbi:hypothetical protein LIER_36426 [Lithospermum erythrorhizon]|uniref:Uncharacterized protein n=1 Tax=Lithospermum erythrorhizon TaxID=34254 RepID=A0AAV3P9J3_LITER